MPPSHRDDRIGRGEACLQGRCRAHVRRAATGADVPHRHSGGWRDVVRALSARGGRAEGGEFLCALEEGAIGEDHIAAELGEVLLGEIAGRETDEQITLFKSLGLAVEDLAAAELVYNRALEQQLGTSVELGGKRPK